MPLAGNLVDDGTFRYVYDAWNRLVKVQSSKDSGATVFQTAEFDGLGRRIKKVVTKSAPYDKTEVYFYDGQRIVQINNGSGTMVQQFIQGTQYIDELVMIRVRDKGDLYVHQDANWNVIGLTDLGRHVVERNVYTPYGELTVHQDTGFGDRDGDHDVDSTDKGTVGTTCTGTVSGSCRILDLDFDGDYDSTDATKFDALAQGAMRYLGRLATNVSQPFAHQGLLYEPELAQYQNRARQYDPGKRHFLRRDARGLTTRGFDVWAQYRDGGSFYAYVGQNPVTYKDPDGLKCIIELWCWPGFFRTAPFGDHCEWQIVKSEDGSGSCHGTGRWLRPYWSCCAPWGYAKPIFYANQLTRPDNAWLAAQRIYDSQDKCECLRYRCKNYPAAKCYAPYPYFCYTANSNTQAM